MATASVSIDQGVVEELRSRLSSVDGVESVHFIYKNGVFSTWAGVNRYEKDVRYAIYAIEDEIAAEFPSVRFDFHITAIPEGRRAEDFISNAQLVYKRTA